jgi:hypothetical protein
MNVDVWPLITTGTWLKPKEEGAAVSGQVFGTQNSVEGFESVPVSLRGIREGNLVDILP